MIKVLRFFQRSGSISRSKRSNRKILVFGSGSFSNLGIVISEFEYSHFSVEVADKHACRYLLNTLSLKLTFHHQTYPYIANNKIVSL